MKPSFFAVIALWVAALFPTISHAITHDITLAPMNVVEVYDGDTLVINLPGQLDVFGKDLKVRLRGVDTPEIRSRCSDLDSRLREKALAAKARLLVQDMLAPAKQVVLKNIDRDMYFRLLADVWIDDVSVAQHLLNAGLARPYNGGAKVGWCGN